MRSHLVPRLWIEHEAAIAIGAIDETFFGDLQVNLGMTEYAPTSVASDAGLLHDDGFGRFDGHGSFLEFISGRGSYSAKHRPQPGPLSYRRDFP